MSKVTHRASFRFGYGGFLTIAFAAGLAPALLTFLVDPYEAFEGTVHSKTIRETAEKAHYPLWKFAHYDRKAELVVLGDSRARALRDKYWREYAGPASYNFAYGGGTIPEIYSTFREIKNDKRLKTLVVGVQLRSFDENHKGGLNRVPEAIRATSSSVSYLKNWFVARKSWEIFKRKNPDLVQSVKRLAPNVIASAAAADLGKPGSTRLPTLLRPDVCFGCDLPEGGVMLSPPPVKGPDLGLGRGRGGQAAAFGHLPKKFFNQVTKNARSDWKSFRFSERYFDMMKEMANWADARPDRNLIFVIPPTLVEMQNTISLYGLDETNVSLRQRLSELAHVIDFDFPNELTSSISNFSDAYHFNSEVARRLVGEVLVVRGATRIQARKIMKRRLHVACPPITDLFEAPAKGERVFEGRSCRVWRRQKDV